MTFSTMRAFLKDRAGAVAVTVALAAVTLFVAAGVAIDMARAYRAKHALQYNVDQAAIAAAAVAYSEGAIADPDSEKMKSVAANFFSANNALSADLVAVTEPPQFSYSAENDDLIISVPARVPTTFLKIVDIDEIRFTVSSTVGRPQWGPLELALVLDHTWSMSAALDNGTRFTALQTAANTLVDSLMLNPNASVGVVPFATFLKVDSSLWNQTWLDRPPDTVVPAYQSCSKKCLSWQWYPPYSCQKDGVPSTCPGYWNCASWGQRTCVNYPGFTWTFDGCFTSRKSKIDTIDSPTNPKYPGKKVEAARCKQATILDLTKNAKDVKAKISELAPINDVTVMDTYVPAGIEFGWHMLRAGEPLDKATGKSQAASLGLTKAMVVMTDGISNAWPGESHERSYAVYSDAQSLAVMRPRIDNVTQTLCANAKNDGIIVFTVALSLTDQTAIDLLRQCASKPEYAYTANSSGALLDAFKRIGAQLQPLKITN
jgi:Flp pilus assembly protein TadG